MRGLGAREKSDERILGSGEFVEKLIEQSDQRRKAQFSSMSAADALLHTVERICKKEKFSVEALQSRSRRQKVAAVRSQLAKKLVEEWGCSLTETGRHLGVSPPAIVRNIDQLHKNKSNQSRTSILLSSRRHR